MTETAFLGAGEMARMIRAGEASSAELTDYFIARIERFDVDVNAVVVRDFDRALEAGEACGQGRGRAARRATGRAREVPGVASSAVDVVVALEVARFRGTFVLPRKTAPAPL